MKRTKILSRKMKAVMLVAFALLLLTGLGIGFGRQGFDGQAYRAGATALAADATTPEETSAKDKITVQYRSYDAKQVFAGKATGSLLNVAAYHIETGRMTEGTEEERNVYCSISTSALAQEAMNILEQETLQLMASPAGSVWGGLIKVYAGETPLLITEEDKEVLLRIVEAEATDEDVMGRMLVANVILNRVLCKGFPDNITEVVFQNNGVTYQFSPIKDGRYWTVKVSDKTREAVERVLAGEDYSQGALFFAARSMANKKAMSWFDTSLQFLFRHGVHEFFTNK